MKRRNKLESKEVKEFIDIVNENNKYWNCFEKKAIEKFYTEVLPRIIDSSHVAYLAMEKDNEQGINR